jgi:hypothetical protein
MTSEMPDFGSTSPEEVQINVHHWTKDGKDRCFEGTLRSPEASLYVSQSLGEHWTVEVVLKEGYCHRGRWPKGDSLEEAVAHAVRVARSHRSPTVRTLQ